MFLFSLALTTSAQKYFDIFLGAEAAKSNTLFSPKGFKSDQKEGSTHIGVEYYYNKWKFSIGYGYGKTFTPKKEIIWNMGTGNPTIHFYEKYTNTNYQVPITVGFDMQNNPKKPLQVFLIMGYTLGINYRAKYYLYLNNPDDLTTTQEYNIKQKLRYISAGIETRYLLNNFFISGTLMLKDSYSSQYYSPIEYSIWSANLKIGHIFEQK